jgi:hypothetical protein
MLLFNDNLTIEEIMNMAQELAVTSSEMAIKKSGDHASLVIGAGLAVASMILVPHIAMRLGLGASLTGALRIALMKASGKATRGGYVQPGTVTVDSSCK